MDELVDLADSFIVAGQAAVRVRRSAVSDVEESNALGTRRSYRSFRKSVERQRRSNGYFLPSGLCNYHAKWDDSALACVDGCKWP